MASCQSWTRLFGCCLEARSKVGPTTRYQIRIQGSKISWIRPDIWPRCETYALTLRWHLMNWSHHMGSPLIGTSHQMKFDKIENHWTWVLPGNLVFRLHSLLYCSRTQQHPRLGTYLLQSGSTRNSFGPSVYEESQHAKPQLCRNGGVRENMPKRFGKYKQYHTIEWIEYPPNSIVRQVSSCDSRIQSCLKKNLLAGKLFILLGYDFC